MFFKYLIKTKILDTYNNNILPPFNLLVAIDESQGITKILAIEYVGIWLYQIVLQSIQKILRHFSPNQKGQPHVAAKRKVFLREP